ncbi:GlxA family transcriptional regulator [Dongia sp.]|uniref:GlxA family transcriptional regulator n=1 Tax=Dongia sp. TaxID=1977262 RepID=UPI0035B3256C
MRRTGKRRRIAMFIYPDAHLLDISGPMSLFAATNEFLQQPAYEVALLAAKPGPVRTSAGIDLVATGRIGPVRRDIDTLLVAGGKGVDAQLDDPRVLAWLRRQAPSCRRVASVCSGALLLAKAGLLDGRRAATHWVRCEQMEARFPKVKVERDPIFVRDGKYFSSAGVSAGMDLALALIEADLGPEMAAALAREFVLYMRRSGGQAQFSPALRAQDTAPGPIARIQQWILAHLETKLGVEQLAREAGMSPRNFARRFQEETGMTPAAFVAAARVDAARAALTDGHQHIDEVARRFGFGSAERLRRTFRRHLSVTPSRFRQNFQTTGIA